MTMSLLRRSLFFWLILLALVVLGGAIAYVGFLREEPAPYFASDEDHFLFGSIGTEAQDGIPYWIWLVLPRVFPEHLPGPGGYASLGLLAKDAHEMPVGLTKVTIGYPRVGINCALCHTTRVRTRPDESPSIVAAGPSNTTAAQGYLRFLFACASDPRFTAGTILHEISKNYRLSLVDRLIYRFVLVPRTRRALLRLQADDSWMARNPDWGRGRVDLLNPVKFRVLGQPIDRTIGTSDTMPLWDLKQHPAAYQWDGLDANLQEVVLSSAVAAGTTPAWLDRDFAKWSRTRPEEMSSLRRIESYISNLQPPKYPFAVDTQLAAAGSSVFQTVCASCHAAGGARAGAVIPVAEVGTDRHRLDAWTPASAAAFNAYGQGHPWKFSGFRTTNGYVAAPLEGLWLRGPYLHNGSVPTLVDLLEPPSARPARFWRGYDVYDAVRVGFVSTGPEAERAGTFFDAAQPGNGNGGHLYGTSLSPADKRALLEYLKTL